MTFDVPAASIGGDAARSDIPARAFIGHAYLRYGPHDHARRDAPPQWPGR